MGLAKLVHAEGHFLVCDACVLAGFLNGIYKKQVLMTVLLGFKAKKILCV